jgi:hypothetical protein
MLRAFCRLTYWFNCILFLSNVRENTTNASNDGSLLVNAAAGGKRMETPGYRAPPRSPPPQERSLRPDQCLDDRAKWKPNSLFFLCELPLMCSGLDKLGSFLEA